MSNYKADETDRRNRLKALEAAQHHVARNYTDRAKKMKAAEELLDYGVFTAAQVAGWLGLSPWALEGKGGVKAWGVSSLTHDQLDTAIKLAKAGLDGGKPKTLIYKAYNDERFTFNSIGGLLGIHKNVVRRIVRRVDGDPWT